MGRPGEDEVDRVRRGEVPELAEDDLRAVVPERLREEAVDGVRVVIVDLPPGQRLGELLDVVLAVVGFPFASSTPSVNSSITSRA